MVFSLKIMSFLSDVLSITCTYTHVRAHTHNSINEWRNKIEPHKHVFLSSKLITFMCFSVIIQCTDMIH